MSSLRDEFHFLNAFMGELSLNRKWNFASLKLEEREGGRDGGRERGTGEREREKSKGIN